MMQHLADIFERLKTVNYYRENFHHRSLLGTPNTLKGYIQSKKKHIRIWKICFFSKTKMIYKMQPNNGKTRIKGH